MNFTNTEKKNIHLPTINSSCYLLWILKLEIRDTLYSINSMYWLEHIGNFNNYPLFGVNHMYYMVNIKYDNQNKVWLSYYTDKMNINHWKYFFAVCLNSIVDKIWNAHEKSSYYFEKKWYNIKIMSRNIYSRSKLQHMSLNCLSSISTRIKYGQFCISGYSYQ